MANIYCEQASSREPAERAKDLFPDSDYLQQEWQRALALVRSTERGWILDKPAQRREEAK